MARKRKGYLVWDGEKGDRFPFDLPLTIISILLFREIIEENSQLDNSKTPTFEFRKTVTVYMKDMYTFPVPFSPPPVIILGGSGGGGGHGMPG